MSASLINQLAERLGCPPEAAEAALRQYIARLQEQLAQEGRASLPGLGHLVRSEEGLRFEPDASLAQAVNHRFAGLEPVVVEPPSAQAYRKTEVVPPEGEETEASKELETAEEVSTSPFYEVEPETPRVEVPPPTESPEEVEEAASAVEEAPTTPPPEPEPEPEPEASAESAEPTPPSPEPSLRPPRPPRFRVEEERRRGLPVWVPAALLIVVPWPSGSCCFRVPRSRRSFLLRRLRPKCSRPPRRKRPLPPPHPPPIPLSKRPPRPPRPHRHLPRRLLATMP